MTTSKKDYTFSLEIAVRDYELDSEGIVNNANYLHYLELTRHALCKQAGYSFDEMQRDGIAPVLSRIEADYRRPLRSGDTMNSCLWVERQGPRFVFHQDIYHKGSGEVVLQAIVTIVAIENGRLSRGEKLAQRLAPFITTAS